MKTLVQPQRILSRGLLLLALACVIALSQGLSVSASPTDGASRSVSSSIPIPPPGLPRINPDLVFPWVKCRVASDGNRWLQFAIKNDTPIGLGLASGPFDVRTRELPAGDTVRTLHVNNLDPQAVRTFWYRLGPDGGGLLIQIDFENVVPETNEFNNTLIEYCF